MVTLIPINKILEIQACHLKINKGKILTNQCLPDFIDNQHRKVVTGSLWQYITCSAVLQLNLAPQAQEATQSGHITARGGHHCATAPSTKHGL